MVADIEELKNVDALEILARRLNAKEVLMPLKWLIFHFPGRRWNSQVVCERSGFPKTTSIQVHRARGEEHDDVLQGDGRVSTVRHANG